MKDAFYRADILSNDLLNDDQLFTLLETPLKSDAFNFTQY